MPRRFSITGGRVVTPGGVLDADLLVEDGSIAAIGGPFPPGAEDVAADGLTVLPCGIDPHVHLAMPAGAYRSSDDFASGSLAALRGGTAGLVDFVEPEPGETQSRALDKRLSEAEAARILVKFHMTISRWDSETASEMERCVERGIGSFKIYLAYLDSIGVDDETAFRVLERARDLGARVLVHAEEGVAVDALRSAFSGSGRRTPPYHALSRPPECEAAAIAKTAAMVRRLGGPETVIAHVSSELGLAEVRNAKAAGLPVLAETCPHYLAFDASRYELPAPQAARFVMSPPLRSPSDAEALWGGIADASIDFVSTDHCPFDLGAKAESAEDFTRIPNGVGGVAERMAYVLTEGALKRGIALDRLAEVLCSAAGRAHGFPGSAVEPGQPANLCLWRLGTAYRYDRRLGGSRCDYSIYEGMEFAALPEKVFLGGNLRAESWTVATPAKGGD